MKAIALRFEPLFVFGVVIALVAWELIALYRHDRRRRKVPPSVGRAASESELGREPNA